MTEDQIKAVKPDELSPAETEAKAEAVGVTKAGMAAGKCFVSAMLAGAFIAFGAMYFCVFLGDPSIPFAAQRIVGGMLFALGLVLVLCCGAELFTGNILMICAKASQKIAWGGVARNWVLVWFGNLAGALLVVILVYLAQVAGMNGGAVGEAYGERCGRQGFSRLDYVVRQGHHVQHSGVPGGVDWFFGAYGGRQGAGHPASHFCICGGRF